MQTRKHVEIPDERENWQEDLDRKIHQWRSGPSVGVAADLLSYSLYPDAIPALRDIALFVSEQSPELVSAALREIANSILVPRSEPSNALLCSQIRPQDEIRRLRRRLRTFPANPIALVELAFSHATLGHSQSAFRTLLTAQSLIPEDRRLIRAITRYLVHLGRPDEAEERLEKSPNLLNDPWLLSSLVSVSQITGHTPTILKRARSIVTEELVSPAHYTELAGALASLELRHGNIKKARRLFERAVISPTENVLAQLHWVSQEAGKEFHMRPAWEHTSNAFELHTLQAFAEADGPTTVEKARLWHHDEPYSSRPLVLASFALTVLGRHEEALVLCARGLLANQNDATLVQNETYALIALGRFSEAERRIAQQVRFSGGSPEVLANIGYFYLRLGVPSGRVFYQRAIELFERHGNPELASLASGFFARALKEAGDPSWRTQLEEAQGKSLGLSSPGLRLLELDLAGADSDTKAPGTTTRAEWQFQEDANVLLVKHQRLL